MIPKLDSKTHKPTVRSLISRYRLGRSILVLTGLCIWATPATAHGLHASDHGLSLSTVVAVSAILSISVGVGAAISRDTQTATRHNHWISLLVGFVIIGLGVTAGGSIAFQAPTTAAIGIGVGLAVGLAIVSHRSCSDCADMTAGAIALHRLVEGVAVAGLWAAGTTVGLLGVAMFTSHMMIECAVIGLQQSYSRYRAVSAVIVVTVVFMIGVGVGLTGLGLLPTQWIVAMISGLLIPLGAAEFQSESEIQSSATPT